MARTGRPTKYSEALVNQVCDLIVDGKSLNKISQMAGMPTIQTFWHWLRDHPDFFSKYCDARNIRAEIDAELLTELADEPLIGKRIKITRKGKEVTRETNEYDNVERAKLKVNTRQWVVSKLLPKKYGQNPVNDTGAEKVLQEVEAIFTHGPLKKSDG